jgi:hypothetical protein
MFLRKKGYRPQDFVVPVLEQYSGKHIIERVGLQDDFFLLIKQGQYKCGYKGML